MMNMIPSKDNLQTQVIRKELKDYAKLKNISVQIVYFKFFFEKFLYRLSISKYRNNFALKGGLLLYYHALDMRGTKDIDLSIREISFNEEYLVKIIKEIVSIKYDDGVIFDLDSIRSKKTNIGFKFYIDGFLGRMRIVVQIDISEGYEKQNLPNIEKFIEYPVIIGENLPIIKGEILEVLIADKFEGMITRTVHNTRIKDYYDIFNIVKNKQIDGDKLRELIIYIFKKKELTTRFIENHVYFSEEIVFDERLVNNWNQFKEKSPQITEEFELVMKRNQEFFRPVFKSLIKDAKFPFKWNPQKLKWIRN
ncbi:MAG: nucleotidyl transferase AbiEii/AbiGii toxin family protein [Patescibacteria group bacterium]|nr:nucleotidyl transferase AbiEii/AbiGii toxin family protein [Patescibacteria group bacterium]